MESAKNDARMFGQAASQTEVVMPANVSAVGSCVHPPGSLGAREPNVQELIGQSLGVGPGASIVASAMGDNRKKKVLSMDTVPKSLVRMEYAVRGAIVSRAEELKRELKKHPERFTKFHEIIPANIGNPHAVGQRPLTFNRQVLSCLIDPSLTDDDFKDSFLRQCDSSSFIRRGSSMAAWSEYGGTPNEQEDFMSQVPFLEHFPFPEDVIARAQRYLSAVPSLGAYSHSKGIPLFRKEISKWFEGRDGYACDPESLFLTDGASSAIQMVLELLLASPNHGVLIPVPQYPLYTATVTRLNGIAVPYYLDEERGWLMSVPELQRAVTEARNNGTEVKAIVVINPGNPTGSVLRADEIASVLQFAEAEGLVVLADEVYQNNVYCEDSQFVSFRKMLKLLQSPVELFSFHSSSKGLGGECGIRGGVVQLENIEKDVMGIFYKLACVALCSNTMGQAMLTCLLTPPVPGEPSYELYMAETNSIYESLKRKAIYATHKLNQLEGVICQPIDGAMYAFPKLTLPDQAIQTAKEKGVQPDMLYCMEMLEECGIVSVPGSGFGQAPGTHHFRITILPSEDKFASMLNKLHAFHNTFLRKYGMDVKDIRHNDKPQFLTEQFLARWNPSTQSTRRVSATPDPLFSTSIEEIIKSPPD